MAEDAESGTCAGVRQQRKQETSERVVAAARALFAEKGFEQTTIREIARLAGVSTGTVMAHYNSKIELLLAILTAVNVRQLAMVRDTMPPNGSVLDRVMHMIRIYASFDLEHPSLATAVLSYSWLWNEATEARVREHFRPGDALLRGLFEDGVANAELAFDTDLDLAVRIVFALYTRSLREAILDKLSPPEMAARFEPQLALLYRGMRRGD